MPNHTLQDKVLALAGIAQAAALADLIAKRGDQHQRHTEFEATVHSILMLDADAVESIFITKRYLRFGLEVLKNAYEFDSAQQANVLRYCASLLHLQRQLAKRPDMLDTISKRIMQIQKQIDIAGSETHSTVISSLAGLYTDTLSTFRFRIQVFGNPQILEQPAIANQIRTCLLAGIRAVTLWRQLGGSRLDFIFQRKAIYNTALELLNP